uniref:Uncharacterized protein n=1 Tax=Rhizophora mucronata TaxID=61149 RepID=A0A2P2Q283_RHIMU
MSTGVNAHLKN